SRMMASGATAAGAVTCSSAAGPPLNAATSKPASSRLRVRVDRNIGSSSTTTTRRRSASATSDAPGRASPSLSDITALAHPLVAGGGIAVGASRGVAQRRELVAAEVEIEEHVDRAARALVVPDLGGRPVELGVGLAEQRGELALAQADQLDRAGGGRDIGRCR